MRGVLVHGVLRAILLAALAQASVAQLPLRLERLVDSETPVPGGVGAFFLNGVLPWPCELGVVFEGAEKQNIFASGAYVASEGQIRELAGPGDVVVDRPGVLGGVDEPVCDERSIFFTERGTTFPYLPSAIVQWRDGVLETIAEPGVASATGEIATSVSRVAARARSVAFGATLAGIGRGLMLAGDPPELIASVETLIPGTSVSFTTLSRPVPTAEGVAFFGIGPIGHDGIYEWRPGQELRTVADLETEVPGLPGVTFDRLGLMAAFDLGIVFPGFTSVAGSIYLDAPDGLQVLVAPGDRTVDGEVLRYLSSPLRAHGRRLTFRAVAEGKSEAVYLWTEQGIRRLIGHGDTLEGNRVMRVVENLGPESLAFWIFSARPDNSSDVAIYQLRLPSAVAAPALSPLALTLLGVLVAAAGAWVLARR